MIGSLIRNAMQTPDGTVIESTHRHDYVTHLDANGKEYMLDGGLEYVRASAHGDEKWLTVTIEDDHSVVRDALKWGTYGKNGDQPLRRITLSEMSNGHIQSCLDNVPTMLAQYRVAMQNELAYRAEHSIVIED